VGELPLNFSFFLSIKKKWVIFLFINISTQLFQLVFLELKKKIFHLKKQVIFLFIYAMTQRFQLVFLGFKFFFSFI